MQNLNILQRVVVFAFEYDAKQEIFSVASGLNIFRWVVYMIFYRMIFNCNFVSLPVYILVKYNVYIAHNRVHTALAERWGN